MLEKYHRDFEKTEINECFKEGDFLLQIKSMQPYGVAPVEPPPKVDENAKNDTMVVKVESAGFNAGNFAKISINDVPIEVAENESGHFRGLHLVVVDLDTANVEFTKVFDTFKSETTFLAFTLSYDFPENHIVICACKDECMTGLKYKSKTWFQKMGSYEIWELKYREGFAFIGQIYKNKKLGFAENRSKSYKEPCKLQYVFKCNASDTNRLKYKY